MHCLPCRLNVAPERIVYGKSIAIHTASQACKISIGAIQGDLQGWKRAEFDIANHAAGGRQKARETECLWMNFGR
jgi:hypothetical protein